MKRIKLRVVHVYSKKNNNQYSWTSWNGMECRGLEDNKTCSLYKHANSKLGRQHTRAPTTLAAPISPYMTHCNPFIAHDMNDAWKVDHTTGETSATLFEQ